MSTVFAKGCCSAIFPCAHQRAHPDEICAQCFLAHNPRPDPLPKSDSVGAETLRPKAQRIPLSGDDYFRLLGAFGQMARGLYKVRQALGRAMQTRDRIPQRHYHKWAEADSVCAPLRELERMLVAEVNETRDAVDWESKHGHH